MKLIPGCQVGRVALHKWQKLPSPDAVPLAVTMIQLADQIAYCVFAHARRNRRAARAPARGPWPRSLALGARITVSASARLL